MTEDELKNQALGLISKEAEIWRRSRDGKLAPEVDAAVGGPARAWQGLATIARGTQAQYGFTLEDVALAADLSKTDAQALLGQHPGHAMSA